MKKSILLTIICFLFSSYIWSQKSAHPYNVTDSTKYRGFGVGLEFYSGHEKFSELFKFIRRDENYVYTHGYSVYASYFNLNQNKKFKYYLDAGVIFWFRSTLIDDYKIQSRSESIQLTGVYSIGKLGIIGRIGTLLNHSLINKESKAKITPSYGFGLSFPVPIKKANGYNALIQISKINRLYTLSGTIILPLVFY